MFYAQTSRCGKATIAAAAAAMQNLHKYRKNVNVVFQLIKKRERNQIQIYFTLFKACNEFFFQLIISFLSTTTHGSAILK